MKKNIKLLAILLLSFGLFETARADYTTINVIGADSTSHQIMTRHRKGGGWTKWDDAEHLDNPGRRDGLYKINLKEDYEYRTLNSSGHANNEHRGHAFKNKTTWDIPSDRIS